MADLRNLHSVVIQFGESDTLPDELKGKRVECTVAHRSCRSSSIVKWRHPAGLTSNVDTFYFNDVYEVSEFKACFYRDVSPGYRWKLALNTFGVANKEQAGFRFCINYDPYCYDSWQEYQYGVATVVVSPQVRRENV